MIYPLAALTIILQAVDLATALSMMSLYGTSLEQNPIARAIVTTAGPMGLAVAKLGVALVGVLLLLTLARLGRTRLARNCLVLTALLGLVGAVSNAVG